jgi:hypothetical protein
LAELTDWHQAASSRHLLEAGPYQICRFGRAAESERIDLLLPPIVLEVPSSNQPQPVKVELFGRTEILSRKLPGSITPVIRDRVADKDYLRGFFDAVVLSILLDSPDAADYHVDVIPMGKKNDSLDLRRTFHGIDKKQARDYLISLLADLLNGPHVYLLPCEAAFAWISEGKSVRSSVESMKESKHISCSSRYGPITGFEKYEAPDENKAEAMINRRFGLFRQAGGMG